MTNPYAFVTARQLPVVLLGLTSALHQAGEDVEQAAQNRRAFETWAEAEPEVRACILLSAAWGSREAAAPTVPAGVHPHVAEYVPDFHEYATNFTAGTEAFHGDRFPAMPLPGQAGALASSLGFDRDDLEISFGVALVLLAAARKAAR